MIKLAEKVRLHCDEKPCEESVRISLVLLASGGLYPDVPDHVAAQWQIMVDSSNPLKPYLARCPSCSKNKPAMRGSGLILPNR